MVKYYWNMESALIPERTQYFKTQNGDLVSKVATWLRSGCILHEPIVIYWLHAPINTMFIAVQKQNILTHSQLLT